MQHSYFFFLAQSTENRSASSSRCGITRKEFKQLQTAFRNAPGIKAGCEAKKDSFSKNACFVVSILFRVAEEKLSGKA